MAAADDIQKAVGIGAIAFGAMGALSPRVFLGMYGVPNDASVRVMTRLWGTRTLVLGASVFTLEDADDRRKMMAMSAGMNAADAVLVAAAPGVPTRSRVLGALTSAAFAGAIAYSLSQ